VSIVIRPTARLADRALLPADPGLALGLAQALVDAPRMFNHNHGLWGYTGLAADGGEVTIQSTGIGGPSAAVVLDELVALGLRRAVQIGSCTVVGSSDDEAGRRLGLGDLVIVERASCGDGTSRALGGGPVVEADGALTRALRVASPATRHGLVASADIFGSERPGVGPGMRCEVAGDGLAGRASSTRVRAGDTSVRVEVEAAGAAGILAHDMEAAALLTLGAARGVAIGCVLFVANVVVDGRAERVDDDALAGAGERAGRLALSGLAARPA
jgi:purine-nucleoside phosphorylase